MRTPCNVNDQALFVIAYERVLAQDTSLIRTLSLVLKIVCILEGFHCVIEIVGVCNVCM